MLVPRRVEPHTRTLRQLARSFGLQRIAGSKICIFQRGQRLADVAAAARGDDVQRLGRTGLGQACFGIQKRQSALEHGENLRRRHAPEFKDRRAGKQRRVDGEIGVLGRRANQRYAAVLNIFEQALLLLFVEILDLVNVQNDAARVHQRVGARKNVLDLTGGSDRRIDFIQ